MRRILSTLRFAAAVILLPLLTAQPTFAWGNDGHRYINRLAAANLPADVPSFLHTPEALNAIEYLGPEPDRWRGRNEPELSAAQAPDHFINMEWADLVGPLPRNRYDYVRALAVAQAKHPDLTLTPESVGLQPWETIEVWERLKSAMRDYRQLSAAKEDTKPVELAITFYIGWLGHYVADGSQPLHITIQYNGWTGPNPNGYTTEHRIHSQFESGFVRANITPADIQPLIGKQPRVFKDMFDDYVSYLRDSNKLVEKTYQLEKAGGFTGAGTPEAKQFTAERIAAGATMLRDMVYTAWVKSAEPVPGWREQAPPKPAAK